MPVLATKRDTLEYWITRLLKTGSTLHILPLEINETDKSIVVVKPCSKGKKRIWNLLLLWYLLDVVYMCTVSSKVSPSAFGETEFVNFHIHFLSRLVAGLITSLVAYRIDNFIQFLNILLIMQRKFQARLSIIFRDVGGEVMYAQKRLALYTSMVGIVCHVQPIFPLILHLQAPYSLRYWPSKYLNRSRYDMHLVRGLYACNDLMFSYFGLFGAVFGIMTISSYLALANIWITLLREKTRKSGSFYNGIKIYKEQQVFNRMANSYFSHEMIPFLFSGGTFLVIQLASSIIRMSKQLSFSSTYANNILGLVVLIIATQYMSEGGGKLQSISASIKYHLGRKQQERKSMETMRLAGCRDLRMYIGYSTYFDRLSFLYFLKIVLESSVTYLLATQDQ